MPRKRATRVNKRAKPMKPEGDIGVDLDPEEKRNRAEGFLRDFDIEVKKRIEKIKNLKIRMESIIEKEIGLQISFIPLEIRNMNIMDFVDKGGTVELALESQEQEDSFAALEPKMITKEILASKKTARGARKGRKGKVPPDSSSSAPASAQKKRIAFTTPATRQLPAVWDTPAITPKFNINLPFTPGCARAPKANERLMSLAGSPVDISTTQKTSRTQMCTRIPEEEDLDSAVSRVAAIVPGISKGDIHKFLAGRTNMKK